MVIHDGFYLKGFSRLDKGEAGAVFVHYDEDTAQGKRAPEIREAFLNYGGNDKESYLLLVPKPKKITACAIVTRSSKNCYQATVYDERRIGNFKAESLDGLRNTVASFFGV